LLDLTTVAQKHNVTVHGFTDDTHIYLHCSRDDTTSAADHLERCIADVCQWMSANRLKLNTDKTELLWVGARHSLSQHGPFPVLHLGLNLIPSSDYVRLLGATNRILTLIDTSLSSAHHVSAGYDYFGVLSVCWTRSHQRHLYTRLLHHVSTTATEHLTGRCTKGHD